MDKLKNLLHLQWDLLQLRIIWMMIDNEERLNWIREARYICWRQSMSPEKLSLFHTKANNRRPNEIHQ